MDRRKTPSILKQLVKDKSGSFSVLWASSMMSILIAVGASYDLAQFSKAKALAQYIADTTALNASIAIDFNNPDKYVEGQVYSYNNLGGVGQDFTGTITGYVQYDIADDADAANTGLPAGEQSRLLARATVSGVYTTAFMGMVPGLSTLSFRATSDVAYAARKGTPASVFFVVDNSGSMGSLDESGTVKLASLKTSMTDFMDKMGAIQTHGSEIFRTALYPYSQDYQDNYNDIDNDGVIPAHVTLPAWGTVADWKITQMQDRVGTDSSGALQDAADAFQLEAAIHTLENGTEEPLKFAVFMTDGANNQSSQCHTENVLVAASPAHWKIYYNHSGYWTRYTWESWFDDYYYQHFDAEPEHYEDQETCVWDYWFDQRSLVACSDMKAADVKIYAIAYDVDAGQKVHAENFMRQCSSGPEYFKSAVDAAALKQAFEAIGESIVTEVIRVKH
ncbi:MAG: hypothetical protein JKY94_00745 [Rhodobacteraceae bacterium]|nr:hypothetical protein [Paracoccaceae bacterium]